MKMNKSILLILFLLSAILVLNALQFKGRAQTPSGSVDLPAYDSGWVSIPRASSRTFNHNLGTTDLLVYILGNASGYGYDGIHQINNHGTDSEWGVYWYKLTETTIDVVRESSDTVFYEELRLMIWRIEETSPPPMSEVSYPELLMILSLGLVIAYNVYNKLKPRFSKAAKTDPDILLGR